MARVWWAHMISWKVILSVTQPCKGRKLAGGLHVLSILSVHSLSQDQGLIKSCVWWIPLRRWNEGCRNGNILINSTKSSCLHRTTRTPETTAWQWQLPAAQKTNYKHIFLENMSLLLCSFLDACVWIFVLLNFIILGKVCQILKDQF